MKKLISAVLTAAITVVGCLAGTTTAHAEVYYKWYKQPSVSAEDIIVYDDSFDQKPTHGGTPLAKPSDTYSVLKRNNKYTLIDYKGNLYNGVYYNSYDMGISSRNVGDSIGVYSDPGDACFAYYDTAASCRISEGTSNFGGAISFTYVCFYDSDSKTASHYYSPLDYETYTKVLLPFWNETRDQAVLVRNVKPKNYSSTNYKLGVFYDGDIKVPFVYDDGVMTLYNNIFAFKNGNKWAYFNGETGEKIIDFICDPIESNVIYNKNSKDLTKSQRAAPYAFTEGYAAVKTSKGFGYYDTNGNEIIPCGTFKQARPVHNGFAWVQAKNGKWGVIQLGRRNLIYGDVDNDGKLTSSDSLLVLRASVDLEKFDNTTRNLADVTADGNIDSQDSLEILRRSVNLPTSTRAGKIVQ